MEPGFFILKCIGSIQKHHMKMDIEIKASPETLDKGYRACLVLLSLFILFLKIRQRSLLQIIWAKLAPPALFI